MICDFGECLFSVVYGQILLIVEHCLQEKVDV